MKLLSVCHPTDKLVQMCFCKTEFKCRAINRGCSTESEIKHCPRKTYLYTIVSYFFLFVSLSSLLYFSVGFHVCFFSFLVNLQKSRQLLPLTWDFLDSALCLLVEMGADLFFSEDVCVGNHL